MWFYINIRVNRYFGRLQSKIEESLQYLDPSSLKAFVSSARALEQYISSINIDSISGFRWISIEHHKYTYQLLLHDVIDDRPELESIYQFSYFEPDDLYGKELIVSDDFDEVLKLADEMGAKRDKYLPFGNLDDLTWI